MAEMFACQSVYSATLRGYLYRILNNNTSNILNITLRCFASVFPPLMSRLPLAQLAIFLTARLERGYHAANFPAHRNCLKLITYRIPGMAATLNFIPPISTLARHWLPALRLNMSASFAIAPGSRYRTPGFVAVRQSHCHVPFMTPRTPLTAINRARARTRDGAILTSNLLTTTDTGHAPGNTVPAGITSGLSSVSTMSLPGWKLLTWKDFTLPGQSKPGLCCGHHYSALPLLTSPMPGGKQYAMRHRITGKPLPRSINLTGGNRHSLLMLSWQIFERG